MVHFDFPHRHLIYYQFFASLSNGGDGSHWIIPGSDRNKYYWWFVIRHIMNEKRMAVGSEEFLVGMLWCGVVFVNSSVPVYFCFLNKSFNLISIIVLSFVLAWKLELVPCVFGTRRARQSKSIYFQTNLAFEIQLCWQLNTNDVGCLCCSVIINYFRNSWIIYDNNWAISCDLRSFWEIFLRIRYSFLFWWGKTELIYPSRICIFMLIWMINIPWILPSNDFTFRIQV